MKGKGCDDNDEALHYLFYYYYFIILVYDECYDSVSAGRGYANLPRWEFIAVRAARWPLNTQDRSSDAIKRHAGRPWGEESRTTDIAYPA